MKETRVFISYSREDSDFAHRLADDLRAAGYSVWVDIGGLRGGQKWMREIDKAVRGCDAFVLVISPDSMASKWVSKETLLAIDLEKRIVPIMWREAERPVHLVDIQYIEFQGTYVDAIQELYEALPPLERDLAPAPTPPPLSISKYLLATGILAALAVAVLFALSTLQELLSVPTPTPQPSMLGENPELVPTAVSDVEAVSITINLTPSQLRVIYGGEDGLNLRYSPNGEVMAILGEGSELIVQGESEIRDGYRWWPVEIEAGWIAQGPADESKPTLLEPVDREWIEVNGLVRVTYPFVDGLYLRRSPGPEGYKIATFLKDSYMTVIGGPEVVGRYKWWYVKTGPGWVAEGNVNEARWQWLTPEW